MANTKTFKRNEKTSKKRRKLFSEYSGSFEKGCRISRNIKIDENSNDHSRELINLDFDNKRLMNTKMQTILNSGYTSFSIMGASNVTDETNSNLSWLINLSAASLFEDSQEKESLASNSLINEDKIYFGEVGVNMKPSLTYTELIEKALKERGELTVSDIYKWIYSNYPYFNKNDGKWKNSIRHNLSINPQFRKGQKCNNGGHYWTLNKEYDDQFKKWQELKKTVKEEKRKKTIYEREEEEIEAATRSIMLSSPDEELAGGDCGGEPSLVRAATEILSGVDREVEVEFMNKTETPSAPMIIEEDMLGCSDPILGDPILFSECLELGFQPYEFIDPRF